MYNSREGLPEGWGRSPVCDEKKGQLRTAWREVSSCPLCQRQLLHGSLNYRWDGLEEGKAGWSGDEERYGA